MSCTIECHIVAIYAVPKLLATLKMLSVMAAQVGAGVEEEIKIKENESIVDGVGQKIKADFVLENAYGDRIGVLVPKDQSSGGDAKPLEFIFEKPSSQTAQATLDKIRQAYAKMQVLDQLKQKGYQKVKEEKLANGSIRLVVEKW